MTQPRQNSSAAVPPAAEPNAPQGARNRQHQDTPESPARQAPVAESRFSRLRRWLSRWGTLQHRLSHASAALQHRLFHAGAALHRWFHAGAAHEEQLRQQAEQARQRGDYDGFCALRRQLLNHQATHYQPRGTTATQTRRSQNGAPLPHSAFRLPPSPPGAPPC